MTRKAVHFENVGVRMYTTGRPRESDIRSSRCAYNAVVEKYETRPIMRAARRANRKPRLTAVSRGCRPLNKIRRSELSGPLPRA